MFLCRLGLPEGMPMIVIPARAWAWSAGGWRPKGFIHGCGGCLQPARHLPLLLSLLIIPIATELPEKVRQHPVDPQAPRTRWPSATSPAQWYSRATLLPRHRHHCSPRGNRGRKCLRASSSPCSPRYGYSIMISRGQIKVWHLAVNGAMYITYPGDWC